MVEVFWLLLPIAALSGWVSGWLAAQQQQHKSSGTLHNTHSPEYFKGLSHLLNEEPDKVIDLFIKLIDVDNDTFETHLALGVLFRRRGEVNRAIRIHENLIARAALNPQQHSLAVLELAQDYRSAGLLDRAESLFQQVVESGDYQIYAYQQLLDIYQQEHEWQKAISTAQQLEAISQESMAPVIAQYYCEQTLVYRQQQRPMEALQTVQNARKIYPQCVRASLLEGEIALQLEHRDCAIAALKRVEQQDPDYLSEIVEPLQACYVDTCRQAEFKAYLQHVTEHYGGITPMLVLMDILKREEGEQEATDFIVKHMHERPSVRALDQLLDLAMSQKMATIKPEHLLLLKDMTTQLLYDKPVYRCSHCGFSGKVLHWQCPSCKQWSTIKPIQGIDGE